MSLAIVFVVLASLAAHAQSPSPAETIMMLDWREKYERTTYQFVIEPRPDGAKYHATITDIDGHVWATSDTIRPEQWAYFQKKVLSNDPFSITQGKVGNPRAIQITLTVRTNQRVASTSFTYPPDKAHRKLVEFLQQSWPGKIEDEMRGLPHNDSDT